MKRIIKKILKAEIVQWLFAALIWFYIRLCYLTAKCEWRGKANMEKLAKQGRPAIACFWHGRIFMMPNISSRMPISVIISKHGDGRMISKAIKFFGHKTIAGSSASGKKNRGGAGAIRAAIKVIEAGENIAITPDGPRGPRMRIKGAIIEIAKKTGAPILPMTYSSNNAVHFSSWDRFLLPKPFSKTIIMVGAPIEVPTKATAAQIKKISNQLEEELNAMTKKLDKELSLSVTLPE